MGSNPAKIGKYEVLGVLGQGGMGTVYRAFDRAIGREVAIKMLNPSVTESPEMLQRFYLEARSAGNLRHPNIVIIYDLGDENGIPYMVMELLTGESLDKMIAERRELTLALKVDICAQVCNALHYAHQHGIIHRDVKAANVIVMPDGLAKLVDFGIVRAAGGSLTSAGQVVGTLNYMAPERLGGGAVDARADVFSAGVLLYQVLTGVLPFDAPKMPQIMNKILNEAPAALSAHLQDYPRELDGILARALAKRPEERYATADEMAFDLANVRDRLKRSLADSYVARARASLAQSDFVTARELLSSALKIDTQHFEAKQLLADTQRRLESQPPEAARRAPVISQPTSELAHEQKVELVLNRARELSAQHEYGRALPLLERAQREFPDGRIELVLQQTRQEAETFARLATPSAAAPVQSPPLPTPAADLMTQSAQSDFLRTAKTQMPTAPVISTTEGLRTSSQATPAPEGTGAPAQSIAAASPAQPKSGKGLLIAGLVTLLVLIGAAGVGWMFTHRAPQPASSRQTPPAPATAANTAPVAADTYIEITAQPWALIKSVTSADGKAVMEGAATPLRLSVLPGEYNVTLVGPRGEEFSQQVSAAAGGRTQFNHVFEVVDARRIVTSY